MRIQVCIVVLFCLFTGACKKEGPAGSNSLINIVPLAAGSACANGGFTVQTGLDANKNGLLDAGEVTDEQPVCNGTNGSAGHSALVRTLPFVSNEMCASGGLEIQTGTDLNDNGVLEDAEVQQTQQVCNGLNGTYDKQVSILISGLGTGLGADGTNPAVVGGQSPHFNIENFPGVDSAVFVVNKASVSEAGGTIYVKLYNNTDKVAFENSLVSTNSSTLISLTSGNIINDLPKKDIDLAVQLYMSQANTFGQFANSYLVLYRK